MKTTGIRYRSEIDERGLLYAIRDLVLPKVPTTDDVIETRNRKTATDLEDESHRSQGVDAPERGIRISIILDRAASTLAISSDSLSRQSGS